MNKTENIIFTLEEYKDSLVGGLNEPEWIESEIVGMKNAKVGTIKANCWKKVGENAYEIFEM